MELLEGGIKIIIYLTVAFFVVFSYLCFLWQPGSRKLENKIISSLSVSLIYSFRAVIAGFFLFVLIYLFIEKGIPLIISIF